jgi:hypothetical protein
MQFKWQGKNYKFYGSESLHHPLKELKNIKKQSEIKMTLHNGRKNHLGFLQGQSILKGEENVTYIKSTDKQ